MRVGARVWALRLLLAAVLLGGWAYASGPGGISPLLLPPIREVVNALAGQLTTSLFWSSLAVTLVEIASAFALSVLSGFAVGFWGSRTALRGRVTEPLLAWGYMVPHALFYPLFILWFDIGVWSKILYAAMGGFFPIAFNTLRGFRSVNSRYIRLGRAFGASQTQMEVQVKLGAALPMVLSGIRIGAALNMIGVILGEMLASERGLGYQLTRFSQSLQVPNVFSLIVVIMLVVALLHVLIQRVVRLRQGG